MEQEFAELGPFDSGRFRRQFEEQIVHGTSSIRTNTMWVIQKMLEERPSEFKILWPYAALHFEGTFDSNAFFHLHRIAEEFKALYPDDVAPILEKASRQGLGA